MNTLWLHIIFGAVFLINGLSLGIGAIPLYIDVLFCFCIGAGIIATNIKLQHCFNADR